MNHKKSSLGRSRDFGLEGPGKGDADRVTDRKAYLDNYSAINWGPPNPKPTVDYAETDGEWPDVIGGQIVNDFPATNDIIRE